MNEPADIEARRRLNQAAPLMLGALEEAAGFIRSAVEANVAIPGFDPETHVTLRRVRAAIAAAKGDRT